MYIYVSPTFQYYEGSMFYKINIICNLSVFVVPITTPIPIQYLCRAYCNNIVFLAKSSSPLYHTLEPSEPPRKSMCVTKKQRRNKCSVKEFLQFFFSSLFSHIFFFLFSTVSLAFTPLALATRCRHRPFRSPGTVVCLFAALSTRLMPFA